MSDLKISKIDVFQVTLPYAGGVYHLSRGRENPSFDATIVRVTTNAGIEGWGESTPFGSTYVAAHALGVEAGITEIAPKLIGKDPRKTPINVACWDVLGKSVGLPVCELLGGSTDVPFPLISSISVLAPEEMRAMVDEFRSKGNLGHSVKISGDEPTIDAARIAASLADRQPGEFSLVDANGGLTVEAALRMIRLLPHRLDFVLEAPCARMRESLALRRRTNIPIIVDESATDETSVIQLVAHDAAEGINFKVSKNGGLTRGRRQRDICVAAGCTLSVQDTTGSDISFAAIVHLARNVPERNLRYILGSTEMVTVKTADGGFEARDGRVRAPAAPGLGITPRMEVLGEPVASYS